MKRWARKIFVLSFIAVCLVVVFFFTRNFWHDQLRIYLLGSIEVAAERYQDLPDDIDTVEIYTLGQNANGNPYGFIGDLTVGTVSHKTLTGADAQKVAKLWGRFRVGREFQAMCFEPVYGLQFKQKGKIYFQTSVCWRCAGYTLPVPPFGTAENGFDAKSNQAQELLKTLENYLPLPPEGTTNSRSSN
jgi:hypothetical protein